MAAEWFYKADGLVKGPISSAALQQAARDGTITPETPVRKDADGPWIAAQRVKGLNFTIKGHEFATGVPRPPALPQREATAETRPLPRPPKNDATKSMTFAVQRVNSLFPFARKCPAEITFTRDRLIISGGELESPEHVDREDAEATVSQFLGKVFMRLKVDGKTLLFGIPSKMVAVVEAWAPFRQTFLSSTATLAFVWVGLVVWACGWLLLLFLWVFEGINPFRTPFGSAGFLILMGFLLMGMGPPFLLSLCYAERRRGQEAGRPEDRFDSLLSASTRLSHQDGQLSRDSMSEADPNEAVPRTRSRVERKASRKRPAARALSSSRAWLAIGGACLLTMVVTVTATWVLLGGKGSDAEKPGGGNQVATKNKNSSVAQKNAEAVTRALADLQSTKDYEKHRGLDQLTSLSPDDRRAEVLSAVNEVIERGANTWIRDTALKAYLAWAEHEQAVTKLLDLLSQSEKVSQRAVITALGNLRDERAIIPLAERLANFSYRSPASTALQAIGPAAEATLRKYLEHPDAQVQREVCKILGAIGTKASVPDLETAAGSSQRNVVNAAKEALLMIAARNEIVLQKDTPPGPSKSTPPFTIKPGEMLSRQFAGLIAVTDLLEKAYLENDTAFMMVTGEIGIRLKPNEEWQYKIRGAEGKGLKLRQSGGLGFADDTWIEQPYEILNRQGKIIYRHVPKGETAGAPVGKTENRINEGSVAVKNNGSSVTPSKTTGGTSNVHHQWKSATGKSVTEIQVTDKPDSFGMPRSRRETAPSGKVYHVVECIIDVKSSSPEYIDFLKKDAVNIRNTDIVLETDDSRSFHPTHVAFRQTAKSTSKKQREFEFEPGPLRNVALAPGEATLDGKAAKVLMIHVARWGPNANQFTTNSVGQLDPDLNAFKMAFAFQVPKSALVKRVYFRGNQ